MMDKKWIHFPRESNEYINGVNQFLDYAFEKGAIEKQIVCPCVRCRSDYWYTREEVFEHLIIEGFDQEYTGWEESHGEHMTSHNIDSIDSDSGGEYCGQYGDMNELFNDAFTDEVHKEGPNDEAKEFYKLVEEAQQELYPGCEKFSTLSFTIRLYLLKCLHGWSNASFTALLELLKEAIPILNIPESFNKTKKMVKNLGLDYKKIDACPNDCMLYRKEFADRISCHICGASRWKLTEDPQCDVDEDSTSSYNIPAKVLWHFPLVPRLQRLFMCSKTSKLMRWHDENHSTDGNLRHPNDGQAWKNFNSRHIMFSSEARNIRLALASDGFNPFRTMSVAHSTWPVVLVVYNLPPGICMKPEYFLLSILIPGPRSPGNNIDVFLQPLIDELKELWLPGVDTYDAASNQTFKMRAALLWTISDFPGYAMLSGWSTKGKLACPCCKYETCSMYLKHSHKHCYMCHRRWLGKNHRWRRDKKSFDGNIEVRTSPSLLSGSDALECLSGFKNIFGKTLKKRNNSPWKKRSIFYDLPYWEHNTSPHNLDVMHIEKNICDNILGTLLDIPGKTKDHAKARLDLQELGIRKKLHPVQSTDGKRTILPKACFSMTEEEKTLFCSVLKNAKLPYGRASNISRCVQLADKKIFGYKSHDAHFILHYLLQVAIQNMLSKEVIICLCRLSAFYRNLCSKVICLDDLDWLQSEISETLCQMERIFPPSFFDIMVHLSIHLVNEVKMGGPVQFRWMFSIERYLCKLKSYVRNRSRPEGSIAEGYLAEECMTFCSRYLSDDAKPTLDKTPQNSENFTGESGGVSSSLFADVGHPSGGKQGKNGKTITLDLSTWTQAHRYVLFNCDEIQDYIREHENLINSQSKRKRWVKAQSHSKDFIEWFGDRITNKDVPEKIKILSQGPNFVAQKYKGYVINGLRFHTTQRDARCKTQNSGVTLIAATSSFSSSRDENPVIGNVRYYGAIRQIIELDYYGHYKAVLFKCKWFQAEEDNFGLVRVNLNKSCYSDDPFVLAFQVHQCFYVPVPNDTEWHYAIRITSNDLLDYGEYKYPNTQMEHRTKMEPTVVMNHTIDDEIEWSREGVPGTIVDLPLRTFIGAMNHDDIDEAMSDNDNTEGDFMD